jgi:hypothetical protein
MFSLATFILAAIPYCDGTIDVQECSRWMANDMVLEQYARPGLDLDMYCEISAENIPMRFWR